MKTVWDFVEEYYPNYSSDRDISLSNDLQKIVDGEHYQNDKNDYSFKLYKQIENSLDSVTRSIMGWSELHNKY